MSDKFSPHVRGRIRPSAMQWDHWLESADHGQLSWAIVIGAGGIAHTSVSWTCPIEAMAVESLLAPGTPRTGLGSDLLLANLLAIVCDNAASKDR